MRSGFRFLVILTLVFALFFSASFVSAQGEATSNAPSSSLENIASGKLALLSIDASTLGLGSNLDFSLLGEDSKLLNCLSLARDGNKVSVNYDLFCIGSGVNSGAGAASLKISNVDDPEQNRVIPIPLPRAGNAQAEGAAQTETKQLTPDALFLSSKTPSVDIELDKSKIGSGALIKFSGKNSELQKCLKITENSAVSRKTSFHLDYDVLCASCGETTLQFQDPKTTEDFFLPINVNCYPDVFVITNENNFVDADENYYSTVREYFAGMARDGLSARYVDLPSFAQSVQNQAENNAKQNTFSKFFSKLFAKHSQSLTPVPATQSGANAFDSFADVKPILDRLAFKTGVTPPKYVVFLGGTDVIPVGALHTPKFGDFVDYFYPNAQEFLTDRAYAIPLEANQVYTSSASSAFDQKFMVARIIFDGQSKSTVPVAEYLKRANSLHEQKDFSLNDPIIVSDSCGAANCDLLLDSVAYSKILFGEDYCKDTPDSSRCALSPEYCQAVLERKHSTPIPSPAIGDAGKAKPCEFSLLQQALNHQLVVINTHGSSSSFVAYDRYDNSYLVLASGAQIAYLSENPVVITNACHGGSEMIASYLLNRGARAHIGSNYVVLGTSTTSSRVSGITRQGMEGFGKTIEALKNGDETLGEAFLSGQEYCYKNRGSTTFFNAMMTQFYGDPTLKGKIDVPAN